MCAGVLLVTAIEFGGASTLNFTIQNVRGGRDHEMKEGRRRM
jgi:hypothetical protein